jgi:NADH-quinone oxidoreductase subunit J
MSALGMVAGHLATSLTSTGHTQTGEAVLFWVLGPIMVISALGLLFARKTVHAAMSVVVVMISLAILYVAQDAPFLGVVQVIVYTGAVMMLFLFVLMLVGVDASDSFVETITGQRWIGFLLGGGLAVVLVGVVLNAADMVPTGLEEANEGGNPARIAEVIFGDYVFAMEVVGTLLVTAAVGAIVMTHRQRLTPVVGQRERADARVARIDQGEILTPLPAPGVYASSNALDVAALGPDGLPLEASVPRVLRIRGQERSIDEVHASTDGSAVTPIGAAPSAPALTEETQP